LLGEYVAVTECERVSDIVVDKSSEIVLVSDKERVADSDGEREDDRVDVAVGEGWVGVMLNVGVGDEEGDEEGDTPDGVFVGEHVIEVPDRLVENVRVRVCIPEADWDCEGDIEDVSVGDRECCDQLHDGVPVNVLDMETLPEGNAVSVWVFVMDVVVLMPGVGLGVLERDLLGLKVDVNVIEKLRLEVREALCSCEPETVEVPLPVCVRENEGDGVTV